MSDGVQKPAQSSAQPASSRSMLWFVALVWPVVVALVALRWSGALHLPDELAQRPRIVVMDVQGAVQGEVTRLGGDDAALKAAISHVQGVARDLRSQGYMVLDESYVYAYPQGIEVKPEADGSTAPSSSGANP